MPDIIREQHHGLYGFNPCSVNSTHHPTGIRFASTSAWLTALCGGFYEVSCRGVFSSISLASGTFTRRGEQRPRPCIHPYRVVHRPKASCCHKPLACGFFVFGLVSVSRQLFVHLDIPTSEHLGFSRRPRCRHQGQIS